MSDLVEYLRDKLAAAPGIQHEDTPPTTVTLALTDKERRYLAMNARYESEHQNDPRYWNPDPVERARLLARWRSIADQLHPDPWGAS